MKKTRECKIKRETNKIFDPVIKLSNLSNNIQPNVTTNTVSQNTEPARTTLNNIDPDPEPDYAEVIPGLLESSTIVISQEPTNDTFTNSCNGLVENLMIHISVWGRKVVGN